MKIKLSVVVLFLAVFLVGCGSISYPVTETLSNKVFPPDGRYETVGPVSLEKKYWTILGLIWFGGIEYGDLLTAAAEKYGTVDDVISITVDVEPFIFLGGVYMEVNRKLRGIAIRYTNSISNGAGE